MFRFATMALLAFTSSVEAVYEKSQIAGLAKMADMVLDGMAATTKKNDFADEVIELLDGDNDDKISLDELLNFVEEVCKEMGYHLTQADKDVIKAEFIKVDKDGSKKVDKEELEEYFATNPQVAAMF